MGARGSQSSSESRSGANVWGAQAPFLQDLYSRAQGAVGAGNPLASAQQAQQTIQPFLQQGMGALGGLLDVNGQVAAQDASLQAGLGQLFRNEINPAITSDAIAAGGLGGGRQGVAQGVAAGQLGDAYVRGRGDIEAAARRTALGALGVAPQFAQSTAAASQLGTNAALDPLTRYAAILGAPTLLPYARSESSDESFGFDLGGLFSFGG